MKPALLVIDVQKQYFKFKPQTAESLNDAIEYINEAIKIFRQKNLPVVCVQHMNPENGCVPGAEGFDLPESLAVLPSDLHIHKTYGNSFNKTGLKEELDRLGVDTVVLTGFSAEYCVLSTYRGARDLDLLPMVLTDALASEVPENIKFVESISEKISIWALKKVLE